MKTNSAILYPQVSRLPGANQAGDGQLAKLRDSGQTAEFDKLLNETIEKESALRSGSLSNQTTDLQALKAPLKVSAHAASRLKERSIQIDQDLMTRMSAAIDQADAKGLNETLVLTEKAAMIVSVPNRTIITAMDRDNLRGNVFTNIDGAVIV
jgi:flagellar operon protein